MAYIKQSKSGTWYFVADITKYVDSGKREQATRRGFASEALARKAAESLIRDLENGKKSKVTRFGDFITKYFETVVVNKVSESTYTTQWIIANKYIIPRLGKYQIDKITVEQLDSFYNQLVKEGVSRGYIKNVALVISKTFRQAMRWGYVMRNVSRESSKPSYRPAKVEVWSKDQLTTFLQKSRSSQLHEVYVLAGMSGMRLGEILALEWSDIDEERGAITITKMLKYTKSKGLHIKGTKTTNSERVVIVPQDVIQVVLALKERQLVPCKFVFDRFGEYYHPANVLRWFKEDCAKIGLPVMKFHALRHTHASILLADGRNPKAVAERLGDTVETVMQTYAHVLPGEQERLSESIKNMYKTVDNSDNVIDFVVNKRKKADK